MPTSTEFSFEDAALVKLNIPVPLKINEEFTTIALQISTDICYRSKEACVKRGIKAIGARRRQLKDVYTLNKSPCSHGNRGY